MVLNNTMNIDASNNITFDNSTTINFGAATLDFGSSTISNIELNDLSAVNITSPTNNQILAWNSSAGEWRNVSVAPEIFIEDLVLDGGAP